MNLISIAQYHIKGQTIHYVFKVLFRTPQAMLSLIG